MAKSPGMAGQRSSWMPALLPIFSPPPPLYLSLSLSLFVKPIAQLTTQPISSSRPTLGTARQRLRQKFSWLECFDGCNRSRNRRASSRGPNVTFQGCCTLHASSAFDTSRKIERSMHGTRAAKERREGGVDEFSSTSQPSVHDKR